MRKNLDEIRRGIALCQKVGAHTPMWVQGGGGNVSWKDALDDGKPVLFIKASGWRLDAVSEQGGLAAVYLDEFTRRFAEVTTEEQYARCIAGSSLAGDGAGSVGLKPGIMLSRPSMETGFHALLPRRFVLHFHALSALLLYEDRHLSQDGALRDAVDHALQHAGFRAVTWIEATMPGLELSRAVGRHPETELFILQNHGVILHSDDPAIIDRWQRLEAEWLGAHRLGRLGAGNPAELMDKKRLESPTPLRFYFPDTAVFYDRLRRSLKPAKIPVAKGTSDDGFKFVESDPRDLDMAELWAATVALYEARPALAQLPPEILQNVAGLPTEQYRRS